LNLESDRGFAAFAKEWSK